MAGGAGAAMALDRGKGPRIMRVPLAFVGGGSVYLALEIPVLDK